MENFCDFAGDNTHVTKFLSLGLSIDGILSTYHELCSYFLSQEKCPVMLQTLFDGDGLKLWLSFARDRVSLFQSYISIIENDKISTTEVTINT